MSPSGSRRPFSRLSGAPRPSGPICGPGSSHLPAGFPGRKNASGSSSRGPPPSSGPFPQHQVPRASPGKPNSPPPPPSSGTGPHLRRRFLLPSHNSARAPLRLCGRRGHARTIGAEQLPVPNGARWWAREPGQKDFRSPRG